MRILVAQINPTIGDLEGNAKKILFFLQKGKKEKVDLVLFSELSLTGYPPEDLLLLPHFIDASEKKLKDLLPETLGITAIVGTPRRNGENFILFNSAAVLQDGKLLGYEDKVLLPTYDVFNERRYFYPGTDKKLWEIGKSKVGITICEDIWGHTEGSVPALYHENPVETLRKLSPDVIVNLSASPFSSTKIHDRIEICQNVVNTVHAPLVFCNQVGGNDSLIFDGFSFVLNEKANLCQIAKGFEEDCLLVDMQHLQEIPTFTVDFEKEIYDALVLGVKDYFQKSNLKKAVLGLSGGIDSALVACIAKDALGKENVLAVFMPSRYTPQKSKDEACLLAKNLSVEVTEISIEPIFKTFLEVLKPHFHGKPEDVTEENLQSRIRGVILMSLSNKFGHIVLNTGNKSELGMGYSTLYGDMVGGLGVINDLTKGQVYSLCKWLNKKEPIIPESILTKEPSAELHFGQKDSDSLPPYDLLDIVLEKYVVEYKSPDQISEETGFKQEIVDSLLFRIHQNEYKRRQAAPGLRISQKAFSVGRRFPIVQKWV